MGYRRGYRLGAAKGVDRGAGLPIQLLYSRDLWRFGSANPEFKETAAIITLYTVSVIFADGVKCVDKSGPRKQALERVLSSDAAVLTLQLNFKQLPKG